MKKSHLLLLICFTLFSFSYGQQAIVKGTITDEKTGETLIGVTIALKSNRSVGVTTDLDGNFKLTLPDATVQTLVISYISYETKEEIIHPVTGETITKNFVLKTVSQDLGTIEVVAKQTRAKEAYIEKLKLNAASSIDFISNQTMQKTGDVNVTSAVARVSGVSINNGFITVRGIGDRYVKTTINGLRVPTLDPFTNNIRLDLFPASLIDNVILTKTANPDLPGDWAGAYISLETKDYPEKFAVNAETSVGYNAQTSFKEVVSSERSKTDWLGYDNGFREYDHASFATPSTIGQYQEFVELGLGDYFKSLGINASTKWDPAYFNLGLVKLGLLDKELMNNATAVNEATIKYNNGSYHNDALMAFNSGRVASEKAFKNNWNTTTRQAPLNFSQSFSAGTKAKLFGRTLGVIGGFRYGSGIQYDPKSVTERVGYSSNISGGGKLVIDTLNQQISRETHTWSALLNLAYKLNINNSITLLFMPNFNGVNNVKEINDGRDVTNIALYKTQFYEHREQMIYQIKTEHLIPGPQLKLEFNASYTNGKSNAPDFKNLKYEKQNSIYIIGGDVGAVERFYRYLKDNVFDSRISAELPFNSKKDLVRKLKFGAAYQSNYRKSDQYDYNLSPPAGVTFNGDLDAFLDPSKFAYDPTAAKFPMTYTASEDPGNHTIGNSNIKAAFAMLDYSLIPSLRVTGGLRVENSYTFTDVAKFDAMHLERDDPRRFQGDGITYNPSKLSNTSYLPSATLIYKIKKDELAPINLRANYSQTIARPSIRELSDVPLFDYEYRLPVIGNPDLKIVKVKNYDLRFESYFKSGDNVSVSLFYKDFKDHIELVNYAAITWQNVDRSNVKGIEFEGRKSILKKRLEFRANVTLVKSQTVFVRYRTQGSELIPMDTVKREMFGQAPYIINGMITYNADSLGLSFTVSYNVQGPRLAISSAIENVPDIYELPRNLLDFKVSKKLGNHFSVSLTIRDILNAPIRRAYKFDNWDVNYDKYTYGTNYVLGLSYKL